MTPNFEAFRRSMLALRSQPQVTLQRRGAISLNKSAHVALGSPAAVELLYDRELRIIGMRPTTPKADNAYIVRSSAPNGPFLISAMAFVKFYGIDTTTCRRWVAYVEDGVLCVNTANPGEPVRSNHTRRTR